MIALVLIFFVGVVAGVWLSIVIADFWSASDTGRRYRALRRAEDRIREAQTEALNGLADAAGAAVYEATDVSNNRGWPSDAANGSDLEPRPKARP